MTTFKAPSLWSAAVSVAVVGWFAVAPAQAVVNFFTNQATWQAAAGPATFTEDFSSFAADTSFANAPVALNGMTISREGPEPGLTNFIDVPPLMFSSGSGTAQAELFTNTNEGQLIGTQVRIAFAFPAAR